MFGFKRRGVPTSRYTPSIKMAPVFYQHQKEMLIVWFIGGVAAIGALALSGSLVSMVWWSLRHDLKDIAIVIGFAGTVAGLVNTAIAYLMPSPLQQAQQRRQNDAAPSGSAADPLHTKVESKDGSNVIPTADVEPEPEASPEEEEGDGGNQPQLGGA